jgi:hypothetical protein
MNFHYRKSGMKFFWRSLKFWSGGGLHGRRLGTTLRGIRAGMFTSWLTTG